MSHSGPRKQPTMEEQHMPEGRDSDRMSARARIGAWVRRRLVRALFGPAWTATLEDSKANPEIRQQLETRRAELAAQREAAAPPPVLDWMRGAEEHLARLQAAYEHLAEGRQDTVSLDWARSAELHLQSLQTAFERLSEVQRRHTMQLDRLTAQAAALDRRISDGERMATEIVRAAARARLDREP